jgi:hypothetical protein
VCAGEKPVLQAGPATVGDGCRRQKCDSALRAAGANQRHRQATGPSRHVSLTSAQAPRPRSASNRFASAGNARSLLHDVDGHLLGSLGDGVSPGAARNETQSRAALAQAGHPWAQAGHPWSTDRLAVNGFLAVPARAAWAATDWRCLSIQRPRRSVNRTAAPHTHTHTHRLSLTHPTTWEDVQRRRAQRKRTAKMAQRVDTGFDATELRMLDADYVDTLNPELTQRLRVRQTPVFPRSLNISSTCLGAAWGGRVMVPTVMCVCVREIENMVIHTAAQRRRPGQPC